MAEERKTGPAMSYIHVLNLEKRFVIREKRKKGALAREKKTVHALVETTLPLQFTTLLQPSISTVLS